MKYLVAILAATAALMVASTTPAHASTHWPATCLRVACIDDHLNNLDLRQRATSSRIAALRQQVSDLENTVQQQANKLSCITSLKMWQQYNYDANGNFFTYMDLTRDYGTGTYNGPYWVLQDTCGTF